MTDLAIIILQKNEALHIRRCLEKLNPLNPARCSWWIAFRPTGAM